MTDHLNASLTDDDVTQLYLTILRRPPESPEAIAHHRMHSKTLIGLINGLLGSPEFRMGERERNAGTLQLTGEPPECFVTYTVDNAIGQHIRMQGHFEEHHIGDVVRRLYPQGLNKPVFVDIGANIGTHALYALRNGFAQALCVEPEPGNFRLLRVNQILNNLDSRCRNVMAAVTDVAGEVVLELAQENYGDHRVHGHAEGHRAGAEYFRESERPRIAVPAIPLDRILAEQGVDPAEIGLAWIDTQGHEGHVLAGGGGMIEAQVPMAIEFWPYGLERAKGYGKLRAALARCRHIETVREGTPMRLEEVDAAYDRLLARPDKEAAYLDLLLP